MGLKSKMTESDFRVISGIVQRLSGLSTQLSSIEGLRAIEVEEKFIHDVYETAEKFTKESNKDSIEGAEANVSVNENDSSTSKTVLDRARNELRIERNKARSKKSTKLKNLFGFRQQVTNFKIQRRTKEGEYRVNKTMVELKDLKKYHDFLNT